MAMQTSLGRAIVLVNDYDDAFRFYEKNFFCKKIFDGTGPDGQRFLHIGFPGDDNSIGIWFLKAESEAQQDRVGQQTAGQPMLVIYTDDCEKLYKRLQANGVSIAEHLVITTGSKFFHCLDL